MYENIYWVQDSNNALPLDLKKNTPKVWFLNLDDFEFDLFKIMGLDSEIGSSEIKNNDVSEINYCNREIRDYKNKIKISDEICAWIKK